MGRNYAEVKYEYRSLQLHLQLAMNIVKVMDCSLLHKMVPCMEMNYGQARVLSL